MSKEITERREKMFARLANALQDAEYACEILIVMDLCKVEQFEEVVVAKRAIVMAKKIVASIREK